MPQPPRSPWSAPWVPLALAVAGVGALAGLLLLPPTQQARGAVLAPGAAAGFQTTEHLVLTINLPPADARVRGSLRLELVDPDGKVLERAERDVRPGEASPLRFQFPVPKLPPDRLTVRCRLGDEQVRLPLRQVLLVKAHETTLTAGTEFLAGSRAALRCAVRGVRSLTKTVPLPGAAVTVRLLREGKTYPLYEGKAGPDGVAAVDFPLPPLPSGSYELEVVTRSMLGEERLVRAVQVRQAARLLLVTDKPLYQPGQTMRLRALALRAGDLAPVPRSEVLFEVEDARGNKVYKRRLETSDYGIAATDFTLADEVNAGDFHVRALLGEQQADRTVTVKPYLLPKFKTEVTADKRYYLPRETLRADLRVDYLFGKPVAGASVEVTASTFDVAFRAFQTWKGKTDAHGHAHFEVQLPDYFVGQPLEKGNALVRLEARVTDTAEHTETVSRTYPVSDKAIQVSLIPEGGRLVPGLENRVFAAALYPDGSPARCEVRLWAGPQATGKPLATVQTNEAGLAEFRLTPEASRFRQGRGSSGPSRCWAGRRRCRRGGRRTSLTSPRRPATSRARAPGSRPPSPASPSARTCCCAWTRRSTRAAIACVWTCARPPACPRSTSTWSGPGKRC